MIISPSQADAYERHAINTFELRYFHYLLELWNPNTLQICTPFHPLVEMYGSVCVCVCVCGGGEGGKPVKWKFDYSI